MENKKWITAVMASALLMTTGAAGAAAAGETAKPAPKAGVKTSAYTETSTNWTVDGQQITLKTLKGGPQALYQLADLAAALNAKYTAVAGGVELTDSQGLHTVRIQPGSTVFQLDGAQGTFTYAPVAHKGKVYVELTPTVKALGGELLENNTGILSVARPEGVYGVPHFTSDGRLLVNREDAESALTLKLGNALGSYEVFATDDRTAEYAVSADRKWGAFTDENGRLGIINLFSGVIHPLGTDNSVKTDLVWSADGKTLYFIQGDKQEKIAKADAATGAVSSIVSDKVENKSMLRVSDDGKSALYIVNITGTATTDKEGTEESLTVDYSKAGEQLYLIDLTAKDAKAAALTSGSDNKLYPEFWGDGAVYLSADPEGAAPNKVKTVKKDGTAADLNLSVEPFWLGKADGKLLVAGTTADGTSVVFSIAEGGQPAELYRTSGQISEISVSADGGLAVISDGSVHWVQNGSAVQLTRAQQ